jgi:hypothetical protein
MDTAVTSDDNDHTAMLQLLLDTLQAGGYWGSTFDASPNESNPLLGSDFSQLGLLEAPVNIPCTLQAATVPTIEQPIFEGTAPVEALTTIMVRNVPRKCSQRMLLNDIIAAGYGNVVDFVYLPTDISSGKNLGYAFINFTSPHFAECFRESFHKKHLSTVRGTRTGLSISYAVIQGLQANVDNILKSAAIHRIRNPEYLPLILGEKGRMVPC